MSEKPESTPLIRLTGVSKLFDDGLIRALDGVTMAVERGEFVAITGPSGCGKSTLLHLIAALDVPTSGTIAVNGHDLRFTGSAVVRRTEVGLVFQLHNMF